MAINTTSVTQLITEFRALQAKDSITPESLGYILQQLTNLLATASSSDSSSEEITPEIQTLVNQLNNQLIEAQADISQIQALLNTVQAIANEANTTAEEAKSTADTAKSTADAAKAVTDTKGLPDGIAPLDSNGLIPSTIIPTEVMQFDGFVSRTKVKQQSLAGDFLIKFNIPTNTFIAVQTTTTDETTSVTYASNWYGDKLGLDAITQNGYPPLTSTIYVDRNDNKIYRWTGSKLILVASNLTPISVSVENSRLYIRGASQLLREGYVPYLFRHTKKRNRWSDKVKLQKQGITYDDYDRTEHCQRRKGWNLFGSCYMVNVANDNTLEFNTNPHDELCIPAKNGYSSSPDTLVKICSTNRFPWGCRTVTIKNTYHYFSPDTMKYETGFSNRMIRLRFAIGFAKKITPCRIRITTKMLVSTLAEFSIIYDTASESWWFSR